MIELPVVDLTPFRTDPHSGAAADTVANLVAAAHEIGFVYLTGHGVDPALDANIFGAARGFFELPADDRRALAIENSPAFRGYTVLGDEVTNGRSDWRDQLDLGPEQEAPDLRPGDPAWLRLRGPNQWPAALPSMAPRVLDWVAAMDQVGCLRCRQWRSGSASRSITGMPASTRERCSPQDHPVSGPTDWLTNDQGVGLHSDTGLLTFILQDEVGGLQVRVGDELVDAPPRPGAYLMNLGEMLETATDGYLKATPHRVVSPPEGRERISIAYFFNPRYELPFERSILLPLLRLRRAPTTMAWASGSSEKQLKTRSLAP